MGAWRGGRKLMAPSLADALIDFGKAAPAPAAGDFAIDNAFDFDFPEQPFEMPEPEPDPGPDMEALIAEAVAEALAEQAARLEAESDAALAAERERHASEIAALQAAMGTESGEKLSAEMTGLEERLVDLTTSVTARILAPVLSADLQRRAIASLDATIREALRESGAVRIRVRGPMSLTEALESSLGDHAARIEFAQGDGLDVTVAIEESLFETKLGEWSVSVSEILE
jgi:hypothetical protein